MTMEIKRRCIEIIPDNELDEAYIEEVLGLKNDKDFCICARANINGLSCTPYLKIYKTVNTDIKIKENKDDKSNL